jgi:hypothetical protein
MEFTNGTIVKDKANDRKMVVHHIVGTNDVDINFRKVDAFYKASGVIADGDLFCTWGDKPRKSKATLNHIQ